MAELLRARRTGITSEELAKRFGVTVRTVYRDLESLRAASVPVIGERGRGGGLSVDRSYTMPPVNFTAREAAVLIAAGRMLEGARQMPFVATLRGAIDKVQAALPARRQREVARLVSTLSWIGVPARAVPTDVQAAVEQGWVNDQPLLIAYAGARGTTERRVRVEAVLLERTQTLLNCRDLDIDQPRQFVLQKIQSARVIPTD